MGRASYGVGGEPHGEPVLPLPRKTAKMMRVDLRRARAAWIKQGRGKVERRTRWKSDFLRTVDHEGQVCDFHALRHTYITRLVSSGASVKVAQELARHSTPMLTIGRYAHTRLHGLTQALDNLPGVGAPDREREAVAFRATGTFDACGDTAESGRKHPQQNPQQSECFSQLPGAKGCDATDKSGAVTLDAQVVASARVSDDVRSSATTCHTAPGGIRTCDPRFRKPVLYPTELRAPEGAYGNRAIPKAQGPQSSTRPRRERPGATRRWVIGAFPYLPVGRQVRFEFRLSNG